MVGLSRAYYQRGYIVTARDHFDRCIDLCRENGFGSIEATMSGSWALGTLAIVTDDRVARRRALAEGEEILREDCVGHNYFWFYRHGMGALLESEDCDGVERDEATTAEIVRMRDEARRVGLRVVLPALEEAAPGVSSAARG